MFENVTVNEAVSRGRRMVTLPVFVIMFGGIGLSVYLGVQNYIPGAAIALGVFLSFALGWLYWSVMITKWRLWAFENVRNVHELQRKAIEAQLIWDDGSFFEKTEIRSADQKQRWAELHDKFNVADVYQEDLGLPVETVIKYSRGAVSLSIVISLAMVGGAVYLAIQKNYFGLVIGAVGLYLLYTEFNKMMDKEPQIILNDKGIETKKNGFTAWNDISNDQVITRRQGKSSVTYLEYDYPEGSVKLSIAELDTSKKALEEMLHTYRIRSEKAKTGYTRVTETPLT